MRLNTRVQKYNLTAANYGLNCSKYYVIKYNMYAPTRVEMIVDIDLAFLPVNEKKA